MTDDTTTTTSAPAPRRFRLTIEYTIENGKTALEELTDWVNGNVDFQDVHSLRMSNDHDVARDIDIRAELR